MKKPRDQPIYFGSVDFELAVGQLRPFSGPTFGGGVPVSKVLDPLAPAWRHSQIWAFVHFHLVPRDVTGTRHEREGAATSLEGAGASRHSYPHHAQTGNSPDILLFLQNGTSNYLHQL